MVFVVNPYDPYVCNKTFEDGSQVTVCWYMDDLKISHVRAAVVDDVITMFESHFWKMVVKRGKQHVYSGMDIDFIGGGEVQLSMIGYLCDALKRFPEECIKTVTTPEGELVFQSIQMRRPWMSPSKRFYTA